MQAQDTDVIILCGGRGTRLGTLTDQIPKPLVEIHGKNFLEILIASTARYGFNRFILASGYKGELIRKSFEMRRDHEYVFSQEPEALGTAGGIKFCAPHIKSGDFLVLNGDSLCSAHLTELIAFHTEKKGLASVAVARPERTRTDGGYLAIGAGGKILSFEEKKFAQGRVINAGIYVLNRAILDKIPEGRASSLEKEIFPSLKAGEIFAFMTAERLYDIGTPERLEEFRKIRAEQDTERNPPQKEAR